MQLLINFLSCVEYDYRIGTAHISIYLTLFRLWYQNEGKDPISFSRPDVMKAAKVYGRSTYHKCIKDLHDYGYIRYLPSHHPVLGSMAFLNIKIPLSEKEAGTAGVQLASDKMEGGDKYR